MQIKIALFGLGRTGKIVAQSLVKDEKFELVFAVSSQSKKKEEFDVPVKPPELISKLIDEFRPDVIVDFTTPDAVMSNINRLKDGTSYVIATTGFSKEQLQIIQKIDRLKILYAPNISDGINAVMKVCSLLNRIWGDTDVEIIEQHFKSKKDLMVTQKVQILIKLFCNSLNCRWRFNIFRLFAGLSRLAKRNCPKAV